MLNMFNMLEIRFVDIHGTLKAMNIPISVTDMSNATKDPVFIEGVNIDGSSVAGFTPIEDSDLHLEPEPDTLIELPYTEKPKLAVMCKILKDGNLFVGDTRSRLKYVLDNKLGSRGWTLKIGPEPEFFLLDGMKPVDDGAYADIFPDAIAEGMIKRFSEHLTRLKFKPKVHHHEVGTGQYEIEIGHEEALKTADTIVTYKAIIRALAEKNGYKATFMPKPFIDENGNGMHFHVSLWEGKKNLFSTLKVNQISDLAYQFIAGLLEHASALTAVVAPTVNSYKRLVPGYEAPVYIAWAPLNRSALIRVPMFQNVNEARFEYRCPDPSCNPYLAFIAIVAAGMDGIDRELDLPSPIMKNIYSLTPNELDELDIKILPGNLFEALSCLKQDKVIYDALGEHILQNFFDLKNEEWKQYSTQVTDWDWKKYLNI